MPGAARRENPWDRPEMRWAAEIGRRYWGHGAEQQETQDSVSVGDDIRFLVSLVERLQRENNGLWSLARDIARGAEAFRGAVLGEVPPPSRRSDDPVLRYDEAGRPTYRAGKAPVFLRTRRQWRADGRVVRPEAAPVAWLHYSVLHGITGLFVESQTRPVKPLSAAQRAALEKARLVKPVQSMEIPPCPYCSGPAAPHQASCHECEDRAYLDQLTAWQ